MLQSETCSLNTNFFITKVCHVIHHTRRKNTTTYKRGRGQRSHKERIIFNDYVEVNCYIKAKKEKKDNVTDVINKTEDLLSNC